MLLGFLLVLLVLVCIALTTVILLQRSEGGALGMGGGPSGFMSARGAGDLLTRTTGILAATASSVTGTLIANNHISDNHYGVFLEALSTVKTANVAGLGTNRFSGVHQGIKFVTAHVS